MTEKIAVEWIATAASMTLALDKVTARLERQEKLLEMTGDTALKSNNLAIGSFARLERELKQNEAALKRMVVGTAEFDAQRKKVDALKTAVAGAKRELNVPIISSWGEIATSMGGATTTATALFRALQNVAAAQRQTVSEAADQIVAIDTLARKMQIQAGLTDPETKAATQTIIDQSSDAGLKAEVGFKAATQLAGSGFQDPVGSGTLKTVLDTIQATSFQGSPEQLVSALTEALNAYGIPKTNENLKSLAVAAQGVFKQTDFQLTELQDFAKSASVFESAGMSLNQALAGFTTLREVLPAEQAGTGMRNFVNILKTAGGDKSNTKSLNSMGLKPDQVDFVGESLDQVLQTLKGAIGNMDKAERQIALGNLFGRENIASAELLIARQDRVGELEKLQNNPAQFETDLGVAAGGMQAERNRIENQRSIDAMKNSDAMLELDTSQRRRDNEDKTFVESATVSGVPFAGASAQLATGTIRSVDAVAGAPVLRDTSVGLASVFSSLFGAQKQTNALLERQNEILAAQAASPAPVQMPVRIQAPAARPKESALPAVTAP